MRRIREKAGCEKSLRSFREGVCVHVDLQEEAWWPSEEEAVMGG